MTMANIMEMHILANKKKNTTCGVTPQQNYRFKHIPKYSRLNSDQLRLQQQDVYTQFNEDRKFSNEFLNKMILGRYPKHIIISKFDQ